MDDQEIMVLAFHRGEESITVSIEGESDGKGTDCIVNDSNY